MSIKSSKQMMLRFQGAAHLRTRLVLATLSGRTVRIDDIRHLDEQPGVRPHEVSFLKLLSKVRALCLSLCV